MSEQSPTLPPAAKASKPAPGSRKPQANKQPLDPAAQSGVAGAPAPQVKEPTEAEKAIKHQDLQAEVQRLNDLVADKDQKLSELAGDVKLRAEKVRELTDVIGERDEKIEELEKSLESAKAGTLATGELTVESLLGAAKKKLLAFQDGSLPCTENQNALKKIEDAEAWLNRRTSLRTAQKVEGTNKAHKYQQ